jgi:hypothetical protein
MYLPTLKWGIGSEVFCCVLSYRNETGTPSRAASSCGLNNLFTEVLRWRRGSLMKLCSNRAHWVEQ